MPLSNHKNILQREGFVAKTSLSSSVNTTESTLSVSKGESRPMFGSDRQPLLQETIGDDTNSLNLKSRPDTEVYVYVYKNCCGCAETDGRKIIEAIELATLGSGKDENSKDGSGSSVIKGQCGHSTTTSEINNAEGKVARTYQHDNEKGPYTDGRIAITNQPCFGDVNDGIQEVIDNTEAEQSLLDDNDDDDDSCCITCVVITMESCSIM